MTTMVRRWPLLRVLLSAHLAFTAMLWALFMVVVLVITGILAATAGISESIQHYATTQAPRWLLFGLGIDVVSTYLRLHLAHGRTRRNFLGQSIGYTFVISGFAAALITVGYLVERLVYAMFGWTQRLPRKAMFDAADEYPMMLATFWLTFLLWTVAGLVIGLGFFRSTGLGLLTIPVGLMIVLPTFIPTRDGGLPFVGEELTGLDVAPGVVLAACAGLYLLAVGIVWAIVRDVPMKSTAP